MNISMIQIGFLLSIAIVVLLSTIVGMVVNRRLVRVAVRKTSFLSKEQK